jgi:uncharacterized surface protein with fasciclin (FAS1) repeats
MKKNKYIGVMLAATMLTATSCSDFSDYNDTPADANPAGNQTLWQNISANGDLTDFASLVKKAGFDVELDNSKSFTVWAPKNGTFNVADYASLSKEDLLQQFVKNHIAEYGHLASGAVDTRIHTLNEKSYTFEGNGGQYTFDGITISKANQPGNNGLMHIMDGAAQFKYNLYEYLKVAPDIDSLRNHFMRYELNYLDENASVKGPMVNGMQTYIDSVIVTNNTLVNQLGARIANEDSSYTFIMPNNDAFQKMYDKVKPYYNYITTTKMQDVENFTKAADSQTKTVTVDAAYMNDSLVRRIIVRNLLYSNNDAYNQWLVGEGESVDTIRSTTRGKFSNPNALMEDYLVATPVSMSNGFVRLVDSLAFYSWETYCPEIELSPRYNLKALFPNSAKAENSTLYHSDGSPMTDILGPETTETEYRFKRIIPGGDRAKPDFYLSLPNVKSAKYNLYVVFIPTARYNGLDGRPNWLNFQINYCNEKGTLVTRNLSKALADKILAGEEVTNADYNKVTSVGTGTAFTNDPEKTDTVFIGQMDFPIAYDGLGDEYYPNLRVTSPISVFNNTQLATYSREVCIAAVLMRPVELEEFEEKNK